MENSKREISTAIPASTSQQPADSQERPTHGQRLRDRGLRENMRVLVCGGRDYDNVAELTNVLNGLSADPGIACVIHGAASGADTLAANWAAEHDTPIESYPADWKRYGRAAGPLRNTQMLRDGKPDLIVAFEGGAGTMNMVRQGDRANVPVLIAGAWSLR